MKSGSRVGSVLTFDGLRVQVEEWRGAGQIIGFTCGSFDLLHAGHAAYLEKARSLCDRLVVAVNSDESVRSYKSPNRPIVSEMHRMALVAALRSVDAVTPMFELRPVNLIEKLRPDLYIKGGDYKVEGLKSAPLVESYGGKAMVIPVERDISTSQIISKIEQNALYSVPDQGTALVGAPLLLLDRDGTLIEDVAFLNDPSKVKLRPGVGEELRKVQDQGFVLAVVTNQQGLGLGYFDYTAFVAVNSAMLGQLSQYGVKISRFYFCPHSMAQDCECRKPKSGMIVRALRDFAVRPDETFLIGDSASDVAAAEGAGVTGIRLTNSFAAAARRVVRKKA